MPQTERAVTRMMELVAWRFNGETIDQLPEWVRAHTLHASSVGLSLKLSDSTEVSVPPGCWVTQELGGALGACSHETFHQHYQTLSDDIGAVQLRLRSSLLTVQPWAWNPALVERAAIAFHNAFREEPSFAPWADCSDTDKEATRLAVRKALTAAISTDL